MGMTDIAISVRNVVKEYDVYVRPLDVAMEVLTKRVRHTKFRALNDVSFDVPRGEVLGIIGSNGAGKSTLLKIITGVLDQTSGQVDIKGRVTAILELGLGFNPEYSGRENIFLSGLLYGMDRKEVTEKLDAIIAFSGLGDFIERPVKTYSSGMHSRLAFSIATAVDPDILIIDEALAAGDSAFVQKCLRRIRELCAGGRTVLLVSHGTGLLAQLCNRVIWIERGEMRLQGPAIQVVQAYDLAAHQAADNAGWIEAVDDVLDQVDGESATEQAATKAVPMEQAAVTAAVVPSSTEPSAAEAPAAELLAVAEMRVQPTALEPEKAIPEKALSDTGGDTGLKALTPLMADATKQVFRRGPVFIDSVELLNEDGGLTDRLVLLKPFSIRVRYRVEGDTQNDTLGVALAVNNKVDLSPVAQYMTQNIRPTETRETYGQAEDRTKPHSKGILHLTFEYTPFRKGDYILSIGLLPNQPACWQFYEYRHLYYHFSVDDAGMDVGAPMVLRAKLTNKSVK
jgi:ABC-type polysaccharide/polyol phosphate transport system ATPase subunit